MSDCWGIVTLGSGLPISGPTSATDRFVENGSTTTAIDGSVNRNQRDYPVELAHCAPKDVADDSKQRPQTGQPVR